MERKEERESKGERGRGEGREKVGRVGVGRKGKRKGEGERGKGEGRPATF